MGINNISLTSVMDEFLQYCEIEKNLSPATARKYQYRLSRFLEWFSSQNSPEKQIRLKDLSLDMIRKFHVFLNQKELKESTRYNYLVTIRSFLKFLIKHDYDSVKPEKVELGRLNPARSLKFLNSDQLQQLLEQPNTTNLTGLRDRAILELLFSTGLRVSELASLNRDQIDFKRLEFTVIGKGRRRRVVFVSQEAADSVRKYLDGRNENYVPLFVHYSGPERDVLVDTKTQSVLSVSKPSKTNESDPSSTNTHFREPTLEIDDPDGERFRLTVRSIQRLVKKYARQAGVAVDVTPHVLRHSFATDLLTAGADLRTVQESLGHKNVATTQIYTHVTNLQLKKAHEKFHGMWRKK